MNDITLNHPKVLYLLIIIPFIIFLLVRSWLNKNKAIREFDRTGKRLTLSKEVVKSTLLVISTFLIIIGSAGPAWDKHPQKVNRQGRDIVFLLDVSKSMYANDLLPSRLQNSKQAILDCLETLRNDRVGLVLFAGSSSIKCPLTSDYKFFRLMLEEADWTSVSTGGTRIGDAILKTIEKVFYKGSKGAQDIILITDGDDQDKHSLSAVKKLDKRGINLIVIGVGDSKLGSRIPLNENGKRHFLISEEKEVWSKMNPKKLQELINNTHGGIFLNVQTKSYALGKIYNRIIEHEITTTTSKSKINVYTDKYQLFIGLAVLILLIRLSIQKVKLNRSMITFILFIFFASFAGILQAQEEEPIDLDIDITGSPTEIYNKGCLNYYSGKYLEAISYFEYTAYNATDDSLRMKSFYNMGNSQYKQAQSLLKLSASGAESMIQQSIASFISAKSISPNNLKIAYNLEAARIFELAILEQKKKEEDREDPLLKKVREALIIFKKLIGQQETLLSHTLSIRKLKNPKVKVVEQQQLENKTESLIKLLNDIADLMPKVEEDLKQSLIDIPAPTVTSSGIELVIEYTNGAIEAQNTAINFLGENMIVDGAKEQKKSLQELKTALKKLRELFPDKQNNQQNENSSKSDDYDESDEYEQSDSEGEISDASSTQSQFEANLDSQEIPPPTDDPMDILAEEIENNSVRVKKTPAKYIKVKKDW